ncbi:MAG: M20/M25/M40 family metallo-hydrolase [Trueperaceae bacterium]|nr:M20/M25/M40 family metallo-hydrolase [Trueperaceae bacterium]
MSDAAVQAELMALLAELCQIPSPSRNERAVADVISARFRTLGATVREDDAATGVNGNAGNLIAELSGSKLGPDGRPQRIVLCAHMDTVPLVEGEPLLAVAEGTVLRSTGRQILGSDDKAGVAIILVLMRRLAALPAAERPTIVAAITICEELGLKGAHALDVGALRGDFGYCFDGEVPVGELIAGAVYKESLKITVRGRRAHAALEPELGVHAILAASEVVRSFPLGRVADDQVANIGSVQGGGASNVVPDQVVLLGEARAFSEARLEQLVDRIRAGADAAVSPLGASFELERTRLYDGYDLAESSEPFRRLVQTAPRHGIEPRKVISIGGSDTNVLNQKGLPTVNVGMSMHEIHGVREWIDTADLARVVLWVEDALLA